MGEISQNYPRIQDFDADFPKSFCLSILNQADYYRFPDSYSVKDSLPYDLVWCYFVGINPLQVLRFVFLKFTILEILNFHLCVHY